MLVESHHAPFVALGSFLIYRVHSLVLLVLKAIFQILLAQQVALLALKVLQIMLVESHRVYCVHRGITQTNSVHSLVLHVIKVHLLHSLEL